jgi:hypothetical protein
MLLNILYAFRTIVRCIAVFTAICELAASF